MRALLVRKNRPINHGSGGLLIRCAFRPKVRRHLLLGKGAIESGRGIASWAKVDGNGLQLQ